MFENPRRGRRTRNFTTNVSKILDLKSSSEQIFFRKLSLGAPVRFQIRPKEILIVALLLLSITILRVKFNKFEVTVQTTLF